MGNRADIQFASVASTSLSGPGRSPGVYLHWQGDDVRRLVGATRDRMFFAGSDDEDAGALDRPGDFQAVCAMFVHVARTEMDRISGHPCNNGVYVYQGEVFTEFGRGSDRPYRVDVTDLTWEVKRVDTGDAYYVPPAHPPVLERIIDDGNNTARWGAAERIMRAGDKDILTPDMMTLRSYYDLAFASAEVHVATLSMRKTGQGAAKPVAAKAVRDWLLPRMEEAHPHAEEDVLRVATKAAAFVATSHFITDWNGDAR